MNDSTIPDYSSFDESFDDLYEQLDDEKKYLVSYLRESIPLEGGWGFFDNLESILRQMYQQQHDVYPTLDQSFTLTVEYILNLFRKGIIKVKLSTPVIQPLPQAELREGHSTYKYVGENIRIYTSPEQAEELQADILERYALLKKQEGKMREAESLRNMYTMTGIYISYGDRPFYDEISGLEA